MQAWDVDLNSYVSLLNDLLVKLRPSSSSWANPIDMTQDLFEAEHAWNFADDVLMGDNIAEGSVGPGRGDIPPLPSTFDYPQEDKLDNIDTAIAPGKRCPSQSRYENESVDLLVTGVNPCRIDSKICHVMNNVLMISFLCCILSCLSIPLTRCCA